MNTMKLRLKPLVNCSMMMLINVRRLTLKGKSSFTINDMSYNTKQVTGFYNYIFPLKAEESLDDNDETI